ncbi:hypothetical protein SAMN05443579_11599 [Variovorax sp. PDC80]|uniref:hypothetical protein n=1 Tax=Variovorax sp. PDC80 TaxID=1882827 RepID=UPI0008F0E1A8|nr:hypothetical protein [Variovorax sp. PDC80]SFP78106.1 hypothetical protein SAMN05443579_11599 [Variovorax sp. PDC80]
MASRTGPLDPYARSTLRRALLPPPGYRFEQALATAYSLDAETLITMPLFAAGLDAKGVATPVGIARVFELGERMTLLVQGDRISIPDRLASSRELLKLVGGAVVPCSVRGGSFHPKLLVAEFTARDDPSRQLCRVVVTTRNLTTDNSWDSIVVLDEMAGGVAIAGLAEAVGGLARYINDSSHPAVENCKRIAKKLETVKFQPLRGIDRLDVRLFEPGSPNASNVKAMLTGDNLLVISPFVSPGLLDELAGQAGAATTERWLVTRPVDIPLSAFESYQVFQLTEGATPSHAFAGEGREPDVPQAQETGGARGRLVGLHAKIYMSTSKKKGTSIVVTSANATTAGWTRNVEVAVTGLARAKAFSVPTLMERPADPKPAEDEEPAFRDLLDPLTLEAIEAGPRDPDWMQEAQRCLAGATCVGTITKGPPRMLQVVAKYPPDRGSWPADAAVSMRPFGQATDGCPMVVHRSELVASIAVEAGAELVPFVVLTIRTAIDQPLEVMLAMKLEGDIDWCREHARASLSRAAKPRLYEELLWHFGVRGGLRKSAAKTPSANATKAKASDDAILPILEKVLLRVHGADAKNEIQMIDSLLSGVENDPEFESLAGMWNLIKASL